MYKKGIKGLLKHWDFILIDMLCLQLAFYLSCGIRNGFNINPYADELYMSVSIFAEMSCLVCVLLLNTMKNILKRNYLKELKSAITQSIGVLLMTSLFLFAVKSGNVYSRVALFLMAVLYGAFAYFVRLLWKRVLLKRKKLAPRKLLVVTTSDIAEKALRRLMSSKTEAYSICGIACTDYENSPESVSGISVIASSDKELTDYVCREWVDEIFFIYPQYKSAPHALLESLITTGVTVHVNIPEITDSLGEKKTVEKIGGYTVITSSINTVTADRLFIKRALDIIGGLVGCVITGVIFLFLAPAIKISSPGSVFFAQERVGMNGKKFKMYKFRSMYADAEERKKELMAQNRVADGMMFKLDYDPRIIGCRKLPDGRIKKGIGNFIRDYSIDEFPQFFNVLKGDMSLVGTRPPTVDEWEKYDLHHRARMAIKPGITGMWQVSGRSNITDFEEVVKLDKKYICEWSIGLDIKILCSTVLAVLGKKGSM